MDFTALTVEFLKLLNNITHNYGLAIILLTVLVRIALWPLGISQQRSMRDMQVVQPKIKRIQERYKSDPQMMQQKMMELYKEHKFNPMAGCLPVLIQMPIFILLYTALISPQFIAEAGNSQFLFINRLDTTLRGTAAPSFDGAFSVSKGDTFTALKKVTIKLGDEEINNPKILAKNAIKVQGQVVPSEPVDLKIDIDDINLKFAQLEKVTGAVVDVQNMKTREVETVTFEKQNGVLTASIPTAQPTDTFNVDVLILIILFAATMMWSQKVMMAMTKTQNQDPMQAQMQKMMGTMMPIMILFMFVAFPIPAGVLLYLVVSNIFQVIQTQAINKQLIMEDGRKAMSKSNLDNAKTIEAIETKTVEDK